MNTPMWSPKGTQGFHTFKIPYRGYEISVCCDDSCGAFDEYYRSDMRVWLGMADVTDTIFEGERKAERDATAEALQHVFRYIDSQV